MKPDPKATIAQSFISRLPYAEALALRVDEIGEGSAVMSMPYHADLVGDPGTGVIHGGAVSGLLDTTAGTAVMSHPSEPSGTATIDLRIDYMRPATKGLAVHASAECYRMTRSIGFARAVAYHDDPDDPIASAAGAFMIERPKEKAE